MSELTSPVFVLDSASKRVFNFHGEANMTGKPAGLWLGKSKADGGKRVGLVFVRNTAGQDGVVLNGDSQVVIQDQKGIATINLHGEANMTGKPAGIWVGRSKADGGGTGLIFVRNKGGLDGVIVNGDSQISIQDQKGKATINLHGEANMTGKPAGIWVGRSKADGGGAGLLILRDAAGDDSVIIDGSKGDIALQGADCAEEFDIDEQDPATPGSVMVLDQESKLRESREAYDRRVAGVLSGAGDCRPALILGRNRSAGRRAALAMVGKAFCKVDARSAPIAIGDLLTTSSTPGHAMRATDREQAFGAVIGKALSPLADRCGMVPILVALQ